MLHIQINSDNPYNSIICNGCVVASFRNSRLEQAKVDVAFLNQFYGDKMSICKAQDWFEQNDYIPF